MSDLAIRVENLGKVYRIGTNELRHETFAGAAASFFKSPLSNFRRLRDLSHFDSLERQDVLWALRNVSFEVRRGEVLGIIGRNGAGKSTLLKLLSRIMEPTEGSAQIYGRVGSLLEVGTGFHPDLTGRENIYLNGTILGMRKAEIAQKFDEIMDFSGVEKFIDTPVKRYSSGMRVRLGFAVAAHLNPEILIVDEVLAVGDAAFQKKCLGKMSQVAGEGRTVLFVSHNLGVLAALCPTALLLEAGQRKGIGPTEEIISSYLKDASQTGGERIWHSADKAPGTDNVRFRAVRVRSQGLITDQVPIQCPIEIEIEYWNFRPGSHLAPSVHVLNKMGTMVLSSANFPSACLAPDEWFDKPHPPGLFRSVCTLPGDFLNDGLYYINVVLLSNVRTLEAIVREVLQFTVHDTGSMRAEYHGGWGGAVRPRLAWRTEMLPDSALPA